MAENSGEIAGVEGLVYLLDDIDIVLVHGILLVLATVIR
jgi:hypothetical protein